MMMRRLRSQYLPSRVRTVAQATAAAAIVAAATAAAPPALAVSTPGWRVSAVFGPRTGVTYIHGFVATSGTDAWATVSSCAPCGGPGEVQTQWIERWSGRRWMKISGPKVSMFAGGFLAASSATDAWLFTSAAQRNALRWNGRRWTVRTVPPWVVRNGGRSGIVNATTADFSPSDLWVFSSGNEKTPFAARYRDGHWSKVILPAFAAQVSAVAPDDIWATGFRSTSPNGVLMHWNGRTWRTLHIPAPTNVPPHATEYVSDVLSIGPSDVWLQRNIAVGSQGARTLYLMHWNGRTWTRVHFRFHTSFVNDTAQDGHGGIWIVSNGPKPRYQWFFDHLNGGRWSRQRPPATATTSLLQVTGLAWIPGTRSLWAPGNLSPLHSTRHVLADVSRYHS
jgi:hypothetical protein